MDIQEDLDHNLGPAQTDPNYVIVTEILSSWSAIVSIGYISR